jgi:hypothetical protein
MNQKLNSAEENGSTLLEFVRSDGKHESYYAAGETNLVTGFRFLQEYWDANSKNYSLTRGHWDRFLPVELHQINHAPAKAMMRKFAEHFFDSANPETGLIPYSYGGYLDLLKVERADKQFIGIPARGAEFLNWFPGDSALRSEAITNAKASMRYFNHEDSSGRDLGVWNFVDVRTGKPGTPYTEIFNISEMAKGLLLIGKITGDSSMNAWADQKLDFVFNQRPNSALPILVEQFRPEGYYFQDGPAQLSDTDTLYHVRVLAQIYDLTRNREYLDQAAATAKLWYERAYYPEYGHFARKITFDGVQAVDRLYGDGKWNTLFSMVIAYRATGDLKYIDRLKEVYQNYISKNPSGVVCEVYDRGKCIESFDDGTPGSETNIFIDVLLDAYEASKDHYFLDAAETLAANILKVGSAAIREENGDHGRHFLRLGLALNVVRRLEVQLTDENSPLVITNSAGVKVLEVVVPGSVAVVYLPQGSYSLQFSGVTKTIHVKQDVLVTPSKSTPLANGGKDDVLGADGTFTFTIGDLLANDAGVRADSFFFGSGTDGDSAAAQEKYMEQHEITHNEVTGLYTAEGGDFQYTVRAGSRSTYSTADVNVAELGEKEVPTARLHIRVSGEDAGLAADPRVMILVDGKFAGSYAVTADHSNGEWQDIAVDGSWSKTKDHKIEIKYYDSRSAQSVYIDSVSMHGDINDTDVAMIGRRYKNYYLGDIL